MMYGLIIAHCFWRVTIRVHTSVVNLFDVFCILFFFSFVRCCCWYYSVLQFSLFVRHRYYVVFWACKHVRRVINKPIPFHRQLKHAHKRTWLIHCLRHFFFFFCILDIFLRHNFALKFLLKLILVARECHEFWCYWNGKAARFHYMSNQVKKENVKNPTKIALCWTELQKAWFHCSFL